MLNQRFKIIILAVSLLFVTLFGYAQTVKEPKEVPSDWAKSYPPFRIVGNLYYVGTYELACYLITTSNGNILINTGLSASSSMIQANVEALGFKFSDIKILLTTQAHYDHLGAMATIKKMTVAKMLVNEKDAQVVADGGSSDYAFGGEESTFEPIKVDRLLYNGDTIRLGDMNLLMLHHPGHTKGSCSYLFDVKDTRKTYKILIANFPTIVTEKNFTEIPAYPDIAKDYKYTLNAMKNLSFDIWLASHASQFGLHQKRKPTDEYNPNVFIDRIGYYKIIKDLEGEFINKVKDK